MNAQLQMYNCHLLEVVEDGLSYEEYIATHEKPFNDLRISIIALSGAVIYDNMISPDSLDNHRHRPEIETALNDGFGYHIERQSASDGREYFYSATKGKRAIIRTAIPYSSTLRELLKADWDFLGIMIIISSVMSVLAYFATRRLGKTIERLNRFADKAKKGEVFDENEPFPNDELGFISNHIVQLYAQWQQTIRDRDIAYEATLREEQEKMRIKRQLTNNINHELKTPVASIQVCLETLLSGINLSEDKRLELIERCYTNNERLRRLLADVSLITRMEDGSMLISKEKVVLNDILCEIAEELTIMPDEERMTLHTNFNERVILDGNLSLIGSIFRNLTENAIAYSGGRNIYISLIANENKEYHIRFEDDGCGVEEKQLTRLFERFYRIDKGRSRQKGGTGLGLAIVKHAVQFHGGTITASNRPNGGLRFDFVLKK
ncbi:sensor histidine kinase [Bacteroides caecimuris]|uniref:sensor histidine kinase n=1 Tax=Bacteroides caecimuris TaxID=1796613 RepID=UPI0025743173|nr:HAMP domain-containing sensor histidine kinase [Bacteroides caecimuris]